MVTSDKLRIFLSLFRGRKDVYAYRWERNGTSGYSPGYSLDWEAFRKHQAQGGTFKSFENKQWAPFDEQVLHDHLSGRKAIGIYPLLPDNSSWFIVADFDKEGWDNEAKAFGKTCQDSDIPAYLERSRSGNGGHIWVFFEDKIPAFQSRNLMISLLRKAGILSPFEKEQSFDRLFPNQDTHSGQGLGNLIALPLQGESVLSGNSCFIDPESLEPWKDQWRFLHEIKKVSAEHIQALSEGLKNDTHGKIFLSDPMIKSNTLQIVLANQIYLLRSNLPLKLVRFIREHLNFPNAEKKKKK
ncbi:MAG: restriction endonuclease subunit R, partial [Bacteroidia bacterium]